jgi:hypothetical protein
MKFTDMINQVMVSVPGCPEAEAVKAMRNTCIQWCEETYCLTGRNQVIFTGVGIEKTDLLTRVIDIIEARIGDEMVKLCAMNDPALDELEDGEHALSWTDPNNVKLVPAATPAAPVMIEMLVAIGPGPEATEVPSILWLNSSEALEHGALYRLMEQPGRPWSNAPLAGYHQAKFLAAMKAKAASSASNRRVIATRLRTTPID